MNVTDTIRRMVRKVAHNGSQYWAAAHCEAWIRAGQYTTTETSHPGRMREAALRKLIEGLAMFAESHADIYSSPIGDDGFCGPEVFEPILQGVRAALNTELGAFDGGSLDGLLCEIAKASGVEL